MPPRIGKENAGAKAAAAAIAFANLRAAVSDGRPYAAELDTITALAPSVGDLGVLPAYAEKGIPTVPELARSFALAKEGALVATAPASTGSIVDTLMASAQSLVTIKRIDEPTTGEGPGAALARAKAALDKGDLAAAVKEVETLDGAPREAFSAWLGQAHARLSADETLIQLESALLVSVGSNASSPATIIPMTRILVFTLCVIAAAAGLAWFADRPGSVTVEWLGYQIETSAFVGALAIAAVVVLLILAWAVLRYLFTRPRRSRPMCASGGGSRAMTRCRAGCSPSASATARWRNAMPASPAATCRASR